MLNNKDNWEKYSFLVRAKNRKIVFKTFTEEQTPAEINRKTKLGLNTVSRALRELNKEGLIVCKTPKLKVGRIYALTPLGKKLFKRLKK